MTNPVYDIRKRLAGKYYNSRCFICHKPIRTGKSFVFHHIWYETSVEEDGLTSYDRYYDYPNQLSYHKYLETAVAKEPDRFRLLCNGCHISVGRMSKFKADRCIRLIETIRQTHGTRLHEE